MNDMKPEDLVALIPDHHLRDELIKALSEVAVLRTKLIWARGHAQRIIEELS